MPRGIPASFGGQERQEQDDEFVMGLMMGLLIDIIIGLNIAKVDL